MLNEFGAYVFLQMARRARFSNVIRVFKDGVECHDKSLTPEVFANFIRICFRVNEDGELTIRGVRTRNMDQIRMIRYSDRLSEEILLLSVVQISSLY